MSLIERGSKIKIKVWPFLMVFLIYTSEVQSQILDEKVSLYMASEDPVEQYDLFSDIMFGNSEYTKEQLLHEATLNFQRAKEKSDSRYTSMAYSFLGDAYYLSGQRDSALHFYKLQGSSIEQEANTKSAYTLGTRCFAIC